MIEEAAGSLAAGTLKVVEALAGRSAMTELTNDAIEDTGASGTAEATWETIDGSTDAAGWLAGRSETTETIAEMIEEAAGSLAAGMLKVAEALAGSCAMTELANDATEDTGASGTAEATWETMDERTDAAG